MKKKLALCTLSVLALGVLASCGQKTKESSVAETTAKAEESSVETEKATEKAEESKAEGSWLSLLLPRITRSYLTRFTKGHRHLRRNCFPCLPERFSVS